MDEVVINFSSFVKLLLEAVPELILLYDEHIDDYDGLLEHVLMGDVTRFAEQLYSEGASSECLARLLGFLNKAYSSGDQKLKELISVSFLENFSRDEESSEGIKAMLSVQLADELAKYN